MINNQVNHRNSCHYCEGKGYTEIRDCAGDIQRTERCSFCEGLGYSDIDIQNGSSDRATLQLCLDRNQFQEQKPADS